MGKLLKPKNRRHLSELDAINASEGGISRRIEKHLDRCGPCRNRVQHLHEAAERQRAYEREQAAKRSIRSITTRRPYRLPSDVIDVNRPRLLSGAEWDRLPNLRNLNIDEALVGYAIILLIIVIAGLCAQFPLVAKIFGLLGMIAGIGGSIVGMIIIGYMLYNTWPGDKNH